MTQNLIGWFEHQQQIEICFSITHSFFNIMVLIFIWQDGSIIIIHDPSKIAKKKTHIIWSRNGNKLTKYPLQYVNMCLQNNEEIKSKGHNWETIYELSPLCTISLTLKLLSWNRPYIWLILNDCTIPRSNISFQNQIILG